MSNWTIASILQPYEQPASSGFSTPAKATTNTTSTPAKATINTYTGSSGLVEQNQSVIGQAFTPAPTTKSGGYVVTPFSASPIVNKSVQALTSNVNNTASAQDYKTALVQQATNFLAQNPIPPLTAVGQQIYPLAQAIVPQTQPTNTTQPTNQNPTIQPSKQTLNAGFNLSITEILLIGGSVLALILITKGE